MENRSMDNLSKDTKIDVGSIIALLRRNWWMFAVSVFVCLLFAGVYLYKKHSVFAIHSKVLVAYDRGQGSMGSSLMQSLSLGGVGGNGVDDEILVMNSHSIRAQAVGELKLNRAYSRSKNILKKEYFYNNSPIEISAPDELFDTLSTGMKFNIEANKDLSEIKVKVKKGWFETLADVKADKLPMVVSTPYGFFSIDTTSYYVPGEDLDINVSVAGNSNLAEVYALNLTVVKPEKKANVISLYFEDINIKRGKDFLDKIVELYNRRGQDEKNEMAVNTGRFIDERLKYLYADLSESEEKIEKFKKDKNIANVTAEATYLMGRKSELEEKLIETETEFEILSMTRQYISNPENQFSLIPYTSGVGSASSAINSYNDLIMRRVTLLNNAKSGSVALANLDKQINVLRDNIIATLDKNYETAQLRLNELRTQTQLSQSKLKGMPAQEREYLELLREQTIRNTLYSFLLQKREENQLVLAASTPKGKIIDNAFTYGEPIAPKKMLVLFVALFMGLMIPAAWLYLKPMLSNKFDSLDALSRLTSLPILGEICHSRRVKDTIVVVSEKSTRPIAELFRLLRSNLQFMFPVKADSGKVLLVTSSCSGEGKTFMSINVAESLALIEKKVVLVGMDIRLPMLSENLKLPKAPGVTNYLSGSVDSIDKLIQKSGNCDVIVAGPVPPNPSELLLSDRIDKLVDELKSRYDYVIIDSAPIGLVSDTFSLAKYGDVTLYVTRANYTKRSFMTYLNSVVERGLLKNVAIVVNDTNPKLSHGYGYGYGSDEKD